LTTVPTLIEVYHIIQKGESGKLSGVCGIFPEYTHYAGADAMKFLGKLFGQVWESETIPDKWCHGIIVPIRKDKGSRSDCKNC